MTTRSRNAYPVNYRGDEDTDHAYDYLSNVRSDPNLHYFNEKLQEHDPATSHRLSHAANLLGSDLDATAERVNHIADALRETNHFNSLDSDDAKQLAQQVTGALTSYHERQREHLEFMQEHSDYELPLTPRQQQLAKFETDLKRTGLEYVKSDSGDITVTFPNEATRKRLLANQPEGFLRPVTKSELSDHKQNVIDQRELNNTWVFRASEDEAQTLQHNLLREELDRRSKARTDRINGYLDKLTAEEDDDDDGDAMDQRQITHAIAELLHEQFEDDNKTMAERLDDIKMPDLHDDYTLESINNFTDDDFRKRLVGMKVDYDFQGAREALTDHLDEMNNSDYGAAAAAAITREFSDLYYHTLTKFADQDDAAKFAIFQNGSSDTGQALRERIEHGTSLIDDVDFVAPNHPPASTPGISNLEEYQVFQTDIKQSLDDAELPQHIRVVAAQLSAQYDHTLNTYSTYVDSIPNPSPAVIDELNTKAQHQVDMFNWMLRK